MPYFVSGLGGTSAYPFDNPVPVSQVSYNSAYGALLVDADSTAMNIQFVNTAGTVIDSYSVSEPSSPGIVDVFIEHSIDDVEQHLTDGVMYTNSSDIELGIDEEFFGEQAEGLRFRNVDIPQGVNITSAYLEFVVDEVSAIPTIVEIRAEDTGDAVEFSETAFDLTSRLTTSSAVTWDIPVWDTVGDVHRSPDLSVVLQEVVDRGDWQAGNSMAFVIMGTGTRTAEAWEGDPASVALLHVEFATSPPLQAPSELTATTLSRSRIKLVWRDNSDNELGFLIERSLDGNNWELIKKVGPDREKFRDRKLTPDTLYYYRVRAFNEEGVSDYSNIAMARTHAARLMHVSSLQGAAKKYRWFWMMRAAVTMKDTKGHPLAGALVIGDWNGSVFGRNFCVTNAKGTCSFMAISSLRNDSAVFSVEKAYHRTHKYDRDSNVVSTVKIQKPR
jgi:hypothetical protein